MARLIYLWLHLKMRAIRICVLIVLFLSGPLILAAQQNAPEEQSACSPSFFSKNGWFLPSSGVIRILVVFAEIEYANPEDNPNKDQNDEWPPHELPKWANELGNPFIPESVEQAVGLTQYFLHASSGKLIILTDYLVNPKNGGIFSAPDANISQLVNVINQDMNKQLITAHGLNAVSDFDFWTLGTKETGPGQEKISPSNEQPAKYDHVMFIWRNKRNANNTGAAHSSGMGAALLGYEANSHSVNTSYHGMPLKLIRHEFSHLILGGNNFHCGGGGHAAPGYFQHLIGGWSILGLHDSSLETWNAWDRQRLGWTVRESPYEITARNEQNTSFVNADLDASNPLHAGIYTLRDFATFGDALRIKLPFLDSKSEFEQYLWIENHQGKAINNIPFDQWQYEDTPCVKGLIPGMYAYMQIDRENRAACKASDVFSGFADYLRPLPANGFWDKRILTDEVFNDCVQYAPSKVFESVLPNALSGSSDLDRLMFDENNNDVLEFNEVSKLFNYVEKSNLNYNANLFALGHSRHAFHMKGNRKIAMETNPSSANMMNWVRTGAQIKQKEKNVRRIYLNGVSLELLNMQDELLSVKVRFDDVEINRPVRWCADEIVLNAIPNPSGFSLVLNSKAEVVIDRGTNPTKMDAPSVFKGEKVFTETTVFRVLKDSGIKMESGSRLILKNGSHFVLENGSRLQLNKKANLRIMKGCTLEIQKGARIIKSNKARVKVDKGASLIVNGEWIELPD